MPSSTYRQAVTDRLDDELSSWQVRTDLLKLHLSEEREPALVPFQIALRHIEAELHNATIQWERMQRAPASDWGFERDTLMATLSRIQHHFYKLQSSP